jgi:hypothetical protein
MPHLIPIVPAKDRRKLHHGDKGSDVKAFGRLCARALRANTFVTPVNAQNGIFGDGLLKDTLALQAAYGLVRSGVVTTATWQAVDPQMKAYERLLLKLPQKPPAPNGQKIAAQMRAMLALRLPIYTQRRAAARTLAEWQRIGSDCSASMLLARALVLGRAYDGYGNTQWIWNTFPAIDAKDVQIGDCILYGYNGQTDHVNVVSDVKRKLCIGFGFAPGGEYTWTTHHSPILGFRRTA